MAKQCLGCMEMYESEFNLCPHCGYIEGTKAEESIHMEPGTLLIDRYLIGKVLGYGGFGVTYLAWDKLLEQKVAIKEYLPSEFSTRMPGEAAVTIFSGDRNEQFAEGLNKFVEEAKRLSKFQNEQGIVKIFDSFCANDTAYIVMEYLDGETLESYLAREGKVSEDQAVEMLIPILNSLQVVHKEGILHRDIAPENIFITKDGCVKLIDFGASRYATTSHSRSLTVIIKPGYSPEEQYRSRGDQGPHTDIYALAATIYKMVTGITPPDALERRASIEKKKKDLLKDIHKVNKGVSRNVENAILNAMNVQIEDRTSNIESFVDELNSETPIKRRYGKIKKIDVYAWPLWLKITAPSVFVALAVTGTLLSTGVIDFPSLFSDNVVVPKGMVIVPELEGMDKDEAIAEIEKMGLKASAEGNVESSYIEAGKIVLQSPASSSFIKEGETVYLTVSSGSEVAGPVNGIATVPYVVWDTQENAIAKFKKAGLGEPIIKFQEDASVEVGKVISQSVKENEKISVGVQLTLVIAKKKGEDTPPLPIENDYDIYNSEGNLSYRLSGGKITITGVHSSFSGVVTIPSKIGKYNVTCIGNGAFFNRDNITGVVLPNSVEIIDYGAFEGCINLQTVHISSNLRRIEGNAFCRCTNLIQIMLPQGVEAIGSSAFDGCEKLTSINLPEGLTSLGVNALARCTSLKSVIIPSRIRKIEEGLFTGCISLSSVSIPNTVTSIGRGAFSGCANLTNIIIPSNVNNLDEYVFSGCENLTSIVIPSSTTIIGERMFAFSGLTNIKIPDSITTIGKEAFLMCKSLKTVTIGKSVVSIEPTAFEQSLWIETVYFPTEEQKQQFASCFPTHAQLIVQ